MHVSERHQETAFVINVMLPRERGASAARAIGRTAEDKLEEAVSLTGAIGLEVTAATTVNLASIRPSTLIGTGVLAQWRERIDAEHPDVIIFNATLTPVQHRNLERELRAKVLDRTALILEIFGERAQTREGRLQVELAALTFQRSRLVRSWTHLERQRGGAGFMGGPGESQLELDRRMLLERIDKLKRDLQDVRRTRGLHRSARARQGAHVVALVGYTNAGKSTLFNALTGADILAKDMLFATLDPTLRRLRLESGRELVLADTVGFISDLPHELVDAFRATLEEVIEADLILHVRDASNPEWEAQKRDVLDVLRSLGRIEQPEAPDRLPPPVTDPPRDPDLDEPIEEKVSGDTLVELVPIIEVWNKVDREGSAAIMAEAEHDPGYDRAFAVLRTSAVAGTGLDAVLETVDAALSDGEQDLELLIPYTAGAALAWLHEFSHVLSHEHDESGTRAMVRISDDDWAKLQKRFPDISTA